MKHFLRKSAAAIFCLTALGVSAAPHGGTPAVRVEKAVPLTQSEGKT